MDHLLAEISRNYNRLDTVGVVCLLLGPALLCWHFANQYWSGNKVIDICVGIVIGIIAGYPWVVFTGVVMRVIRRKWIRSYRIVPDGERLLVLGSIPAVEYESVYRQLRAMRPGYKILTAPNQFKCVLAAVPNDDMMGEWA